ncbi:MAG: Flp pilus assembly protein CpaB [Acidimicrobiia bacterium]
MSSKRTLILIAAVLIGAIGAWSVYSYVNGIEDRAYNNAKLVEVWVVKQNISANTQGEQVLGDKLIQKGEVPQQYRPTTALTDLSSIAGKVAKYDLAPNQVLVQGMFVDKTQAVSTVADRIPAGQVAVSVNLDQVHAAANFPQAGDRVNLLVSLDATQAASAGISNAPGATGNATNAAKDSTGGAIRFLYQNVEILAVGPTAEGAANGSTTAAASGLITFVVPPDAAQRIALVGSSLYLTLVPKNYVPVDLPGVDYRNLFQTDGLTPYDKKS